MQPRRVFGRKETYISSIRTILKKIGGFTGVLVSFSRDLCVKASRLRRNLQAADLLQLQKEQCELLNMLLTELSTEIEGAGLILVLISVQVDRPLHRLIEKVTQSPS